MEISSYRSKSFGILIAIKVVQLTIKYLTNNNILIQRVKIKLICNNEAIVKTVNKMKYSKMTLKQHYEPDSDTIGAILLGLKNIPWQCTMEIHHIAGQQDKNNTTLTREGELNLEVDQMATIGLKKKNVKPVLLPGNKTYL
jgi:hypothetical protein